MFFDMWVMDFQFGLADKDYFKGLVQQGILPTDKYKQIVGEDYEAPKNTTK